VTNFIFPIRSNNFMKKKLNGTRSVPFNLRTALAGEEAGKLQLTPFWQQACSKQLQQDEEILTLSSRFQCVTIKYSIPPPEHKALPEVEAEGWCIGSRRRSAVLHSLYTLLLYLGAISRLTIS